MKITVNDKQLETKFNFKSIDEWYKQFANLKTNEDLFDNIFTGLIVNNPMALAKTLYGGLAYLKKDMPAFDVFFDALSDYEATLDDVNVLFAETLAELNASGFFGLQLQAWKKQLESYKNQSETALKQLQEPKRPTKEEKDDYDKKHDQLVDLQKSTENVLTALKAKLSTTDNG
ncbi:tail assembly chaperone [Loigolactobacillus backii]|uniref:tail assembly chaperone n=1 Tax=Loigolactobacillus backii TaxID=375175 RepID=UPI0007F08874|nr:tail assembly chaperone [Loigolactobacillus backii]ANK59812.1 hypothetical protein AYR52_05785 [Loigolactobacillus backii]